MSFIRSMFSESDGSISEARVQSMLHCIAGISWISMFMVHNQFHLPDIATLGGISTFIVGPYAVNKVSTMFGKDQG